MSEVAAAGGGVEVLESDGRSMETPDWLEVENPGDVAVPLASCSFVLNGNRLELPEHTVEARARQIILFSKKELASPLPRVSARIDGEGGKLRLGERELTYPAAGPYTFGWYAGAYQTLIPTPGAANEPAPRSAPPAPTLTPSHGFYRDPIVVRATANDEVRYTLDGTEPNHTSPTLEPAGLKVERTTMVRVATFVGNTRSEVTTVSYVFDAPGCRERSLPAISLVGAPEDLFGPSGLLGHHGGVFAPDPNGDLEWKPTNDRDFNNALQRDLERPVSVELFRVDDECSTDRHPWPDRTFTAGLRIHGSDWGRKHIRPCPVWADDWTCKPSFRIHLRPRFGTAELRDEPVFVEEGPKRQDALILANPTDVDGSIPHNDALMRSLARSLELPTPRGRFVSVYVNASFAGLYELLERPRSAWAEQILESGSVDIIDQEGTRAGDADRLAKALRSAEDGDFGALERAVDLEKTVDYLLLQLYAANSDWPDNNWMAIAKKRGRFVFVVWDAESAFLEEHLRGDGFREFPTWMEGGGHGLAGASPLGRIYRAIQRHRPELWRARAEALFSANGKLTDAVIREHYERVHGRLRYAVPNLESFIGDAWIPRRRAVFERQLEREAR